MIKISKKEWKEIYSALEAYWGAEECVDGKVRVDENQSQPRLKNTLMRKIERLAFEKIFTGVLDSEYSLQFWFDSSGTLNCMENSNTDKFGTFKNNRLDMMLFGKGIANSKLLDIVDKDVLKLFCSEYLQELEKHINV